MDVETTATSLAETEADLHVLALADGEKLPSEFGDAPGGADVKTAFKKLTVVRPGSPERLLVVGLGKPEDVDAERLRVAAALAVKQAGRFDATAIAFALPAAGPGDEASAAALVDGAVLASYRFDRFRNRDEDDPEPPRLERVVVSGSAEGGVAEAARVAGIASDAANRARELQSLPSN